MSITVTTNELEVVGAGAGAPVDGISPPIADTESTQASAAANIKRFMFVSFVNEDARTLAIIPHSFPE